MPILAWSGTALVGQALDFAQIWMNEGAVASGPDEVEIVGDLCVFPVITLFGTLTAPITVTYGPNQFVYREDVTDVVAIDTWWGRATTITVATTAALHGNFPTQLYPRTPIFSNTT